MSRTIGIACLFLFVAWILWCCSFQLSTRVKLHNPTIFEEVRDTRVNSKLAVFCTAFVIRKERCSRGFSFQKKMFPSPTLLSAKRLTRLKSSKLTDLQYILGATAIHQRKPKVFKTTNILPHVVAWVDSNTKCRLPWLCRIWLDNYLPSPSTTWGLSFFPILQRTPQAPA